MRIFKLSSIAAILGFIFLGVSYVAASRLEEAKAHSFPENLARHYSRVSNHVFEGGTFAGGEMVKFEKSISNPPSQNAKTIETLEIETVALDVEILPNETEQIDVRLNSNRIDPKEPVLVDTEVAGTLRILTHEESSKQNSRGWFVFNFESDDKSHQGARQEPRRNVLEVRVPKSVRDIRIRTISGDGRLATAVAATHFQSKSGDFEIKTKDNPLARVESLHIETVSGDLKGPGRFDRLRFNSVSGDIRLTSFDRVLDIDAQTISGDVRIRTNEKIDAGIEFSTQSGSLKIDPTVADQTGNTTGNTTRNHNVTLGKGTSRIKLHSVSGDLRIKRSKSDASSNESSEESSEDSSDDSSDSDESDSHDESSADWEDGNSQEDALNSLGSGEVVLARLYQSADSSFLSCVARVAIQENTRIGATSSVRRCIKVIV